MEKWRNIPLSKEEEEGVTAAVDEVCDEEVFQRTLVGKLWTERNFNTRAFTSTMIEAWKLRNPVEIQELSKNLFLFKFATKRDLENVLKNGPWSFDHNLLVLERVSGEEQPSDLNMHFVVFWVRIYELPLMLRSETMAWKIGGILGTFEEMDQKDAHRNGRFLRIKVKMDLKLPLKRGTVVKFKEKKLRVHFKYKRLPNFCFACGRLGHQLKDCEALEGLGEEGFEELDEQDLSFGLWLRASPLPKAIEEQKRKESSSSTCSKSLFNVSSSHSRCGNKGKDKGGEEVEQQHGGNGSSKETQEVQKKDKVDNMREIESVAESLGAVEISNKINLSSGKQRVETDTVEGDSIPKKRKWIRKKPVKKVGPVCVVEKGGESGKRQLFEIPITKGSVEEMGQVIKKRKQPVAVEGSASQKQEVVLEDQHCLTQ
ncbi:uncharacterized protein LOC131656565 [Vicia villosa]|uniref:uncharacterized protein LOC131656565 n=1 Tax=Vicia villosa TaxID=3911 RepID=UPI00273C235E|nr:uncharacterized protein LOC131656565 [Vicia villosa]